MCVRNTQARCLAAKPVLAHRVVAVALLLFAYIAIVENIF